jgi:glucose-6-phosphate 1-dehydrogenase
MTSQKPNIPTVFVIFGATGDLTSRKIAPAVFRLYEKRKLPAMLRIIGFARRTLTNDQFRQMIAASLQKHGIDITKDTVGKFLNHITYQQGDFTTISGYQALSRDLGQVDGEWNVCSNKLFYLAVPPQHYRIIFENLNATGLTIPCGPEEGWTRVLVEKPFGRDLQTSHELDALLGTLFKEEQIYRIDHYLAKEMLQNILTFRFANNLFEKSWSAETIESIEIKFFETLGVESRASLYDDIGSLRDVGQNHLLQMLALVTMEKPVAFTASHIRQERANLLRQLRVPTYDEAACAVFRAQYEGYTEIADVRPDSQTETYFKLKLSLDSERWAGVPMYLEAGKKLAESKKEIVVTFKKPQPPLFVSEGSIDQNIISFTVDPQEGINVQFLAKVPGHEYVVQPTRFTFHSHEKERLINEYEKLLMDAIVGDQTLFVSTDEIRAMWRVVDQFLNVFKDHSVPLHRYKPGDASVTVNAHQFLTENRHEKVVGIVGLGKMGANLARQMTRNGALVVGYNRTAEDTKRLEVEGIVGAYSLSQLVSKLPSPRVIWLMLPAGSPTDETLFAPGGLIELLSAGDIVIDGSNAFYEVSRQRGEKLAQKSIHYIDVGVSGGPSGALNGACLMVGGEKKVYELILPILRLVAAPGAIAHFEGVGAGHFVKMVHNGIEYGMMQSIAEGFAVLKKAPYNLSLKQAAYIYQKRSVIESRLVGWTKDAFEKHGEELDDVTSTVAHTGEGLWTVQTAEKFGIRVPAIADALKFRQESAKNPSFIGRVLSALRGEFGGHATK